ncbi:MAG: Glu/Leu/Phe/Val dehydrogenase dimerization domain-containing protein [Rhodospirillales bacterium]|jgi:leucine dehydrogenase|nr:Glu/Leu/Phe/Val dehydrogenase dimerization domain-containing protein [Rhodospirillales bacterium]
MKVLETSSQRQPFSPPGAGTRNLSPTHLPQDVTLRARRLAEFSNHQQVWECRHPASGLHAFIAVHDTTLGPALGGCRMWPYGSTDHALGDALRLSRGMTYKAALAGVALGGGKAVILGDPKTGKSERLFHAFGAMVEALGGLYITAEDVGTSVGDMDWIAETTAHVTGTSRNGGDPSPMTALGVYEGIRAAVKHRLGSTDLSEVTVAVQGLGHVGRALCQRLAADGANLIVADVDADAVKFAVDELGATATEADRIHAVAADVFAPCALGAVLDDETVPALRSAIVAGAANNQLAQDRHGQELHRRGILYAPDYVINAGGLISVAQAVAGEDASGTKAWSAVRRIGAVLSEIFDRAEAEGRSPGAIADRLAVERIAGHRRGAREAKR